MSWMRTDAPRPVMLARCVAQLSRSHTDQAELDAFLRRCLERFDERAVLGAVSKAVRQLPPSQAHAQVRLVRTAIRLLPMPAAESFADRHLDVVLSQPASRRELAWKLYKVGRLMRPAELLDPSDLPSEPLRRNAVAETRALAEGVPLSAPLPSPVAAGDRVMYVVAHSLPVQGVGYTIRTQWLARHLRELGWALEVFARFGYPADRADTAGPTDLTHAEVDGVPYHFSPDPGARDLDLQAYIQAGAADIVRQAASFRPSVIHCASNFRVGLAGVEAARQLGIPSIYEVRGLWHYSRAAKERDYEGTEHFRLGHKLELQAAASADRLLTNGPALRDLFIAAGVAAGRITDIPNGVDPDLFETSTAAAPALQQQLGLGGRTVIGYIGTFFDFEGLDDLIRAADKLRQRHGDSFRVLLVGDGPEYESLTRLVQELGLADIVRFTGRVPHDIVRDYYSIIDVAVYPRRGAPVCEMVPPLKPLEAMAARVPVVVSSAAAIASLVVPGRTGLVHAKDDVASLCRCLGQLLESRALRQELAAAAHERVQGSRWSDSAAKIAAVYRDLGMRL
jgi:glycosyltransferase involved in cell wall biosynthesis